MNALHAVFAAVDWAGLAVWTMTLSLLLVGTIGLVLPLVPGPLILFGAMLLHSWLRPESGLHGWYWAAESLLLALALACDFICGVLGARWFGGSAWGLAGVFAGTVVGFFFGLPGMIVGPLAGCLCFELMFAQKRFQPAVKSTLGTALGTGAGLLARVVVGLVMLVVFLFSAFWRS